MMMILLASLFLCSVAVDRRFLRDVSLQVEVIGSDPWVRMWGWSDAAPLQVLSVYLGGGEGDLEPTVIPCDPLPPCAPIRHPCNISTHEGGALELWVPLPQTRLIDHVMLYLTLTDGLEVGRVAARALTVPAAHHCAVGPAFLPNTSPLPAVVVVRSGVPIDTVVFNGRPFTPEDTKQCRWTTGTAADSAWLEENVFGVPNVSLTTVLNDVWFLPHEPGALAVTFDSEKINA
jgi:hypothetical protein